MTHVNPQPRQPSCYNRTGAFPGYFARDGVVVDTINHPDHGLINVSRFRLKYIEHTMTTACQQDGSLPECHGCTKARNYDTL